MIRSRTFWYATFCIVGLVIFALIATLVFGPGAGPSYAVPGEMHPNALALDRDVFLWFKQFRSPVLNIIVTDLTALGSFSVLTLMGVCVLGVLILFRQNIRIIELVLIGAGSAIWPRILKALFHRARPEELDRLISVTEFSFPSGHAFGSSAMYLAFGLLAAEIMRTRARKAYCIGFAILTILLVGLSRIYLGVHYTTDVIAGFALGSTWTLSVTLAFDLLRARSLARRQSEEIV
jgi:undecaprenyl-diphosphatase